MSESSQRFDPFGDLCLPNRVNLNAGNLDGLMNSKDRSNASLFTMSQTKESPLSPKDLNCNGYNSEICMNSTNTKIRDMSSPGYSSKNGVSGVPDLHLTPLSSHSNTPLSTPSSRGSPTRRLSKCSSAADPMFLNSPIPVSSKSFLDDDWLRERVRVDSNMALVAGGLIRSTSASPVPSSSCPTTNATEPLSSNNSIGGSRNLPAAFGCHRPPKDYLCKLCNTAGHWMRDCQLFQPREGITRFPPGLGSFARNNASTVPPPPANYICRLCGVGGHWIEHCSQFQPKGKGSGPVPDNYVCNLCKQPGHWIQQCSEFTPMPRKSSRH